MGVVILPFPDQTVIGSRLLPRDKMELHAWQGCRPASAVDHVVLHDGADEAEFVLAYEAGASWATWGLARQRGGIVLWECAYGRDLGVFPTMDAALVILDHYAAFATRRAAHAGRTRADTRRNAP